MRPCYLREFGIAQGRSELGHLLAHPFWIQFFVSWWTERQVEYYQLECRVELSSFDFAGRKQKTHISLSRQLYISNLFTLRLSRNLASGMYPLQRSTSLPSALNFLACNSTVIVRLTKRSGAFRSILLLIFDKVYLLPSSNSGTSIPSILIGSWSLSSKTISTLLFKRFSWFKNLIRETCMFSIVARLIFIFLSKKFLS